MRGPSAHGTLNSLNSITCSRFEGLSSLPGGAGDTLSKKAPLSRTVYVHSAREGNGTWRWRGFGPSLEGT